MNYTVHFTKLTSISVTVDAEDPQDAIEAALDAGPGGICAHCAGWQQAWSRDEGDELEPEYVLTEAGNEVWKAPDQWQRVLAGGA